MSTTADDHRCLPGVARGLSETGRRVFSRTCTTRLGSRRCSAEIFAATGRHHLYHDGALVQTVQPELTAQQTQVLDLLALPPAVYTQHT